MNRRQRRQLTRSALLGAESASSFREGFAWLRLMAALGELEPGQVPAGLPAPEPRGCAHVGAGRLAFVAAWDPAAGRLCGAGRCVPVAPVSWRCDVCGEVGDVRPHMGVRDGVVVLWRGCAGHQVPGYSLAPLTQDSGTA